MSIIEDIVKLTRAGWRPYEGRPLPAVYERLECPHAKGARNRPKWFVREDNFLCVGCSRRCLLKRPQGFSLPLPIRYGEASWLEPYTLTPQEMMARRSLLTVKQAAYCLNVSPRQIYTYIAEGRLVKLKDGPVRVRVDEVRQMAQDFDE